MGAYLVLYWIALISAIICYSLSKKKKSKTYENLSNFLVLLMIFFFVIALATDDPIEELLTTIPAFWQFTLTSLGGAFVIWRTYLNPLKKQVIECEKDIREINTNIGNINKNIDEIKPYVMKKK